MVGTWPYPHEHSTRKKDESLGLAFSKPSFTTMPALEAKVNLVTEDLKSYSAAMGLRQDQNGDIVDKDGKKVSPEQFRQKRKASEIIGDDEEGWNSKFAKKSSVKKLESQMVIAQNAHHIQTNVIDLLVGQVSDSAKVIERQGEALQSLGKSLRNMGKSMETIGEEVHQIGKSSMETGNDSMAFFSKSMNLLSWGNALSTHAKNLVTEPFYHPHVEYVEASGGDKLVTYVGPPLEDKKVQPHKLVGDQSYAPGDETSEAYALGNEDTEDADEEEEEEEEEEKEK